VSTSSKLDWNIGNMLEAEVKQFDGFVEGVNL
jgi:hypothetical protein